MRVQIHIQTSDEAIDDFVALIKAMAEEKVGKELASSQSGPSRTRYPARL
jgi:hypothetical protein